MKKVDGEDDLKHHMHAKQSIHAITMAPSMTTAATSIYDPRHRKALEEFTQRLLTQVHCTFDIPYEYLLRDIYDTMVWSTPPPPPPQQSKINKNKAEKEAKKDIKTTIKKKLHHLELLVVDDGEPFWVDTKTGLLYTYKDKILIASLHPTLGSSSPADLASDSCSSLKSKLWM